MEKKMFELEEVIETTLIIYLKNRNAWQNYYDRESSIIDKPFDTMSE